jgi:hypothetical protein
MAYGLADISGGVQHVGGDDHIIAAGLDALCRQRCGDIENAIGQAGITLPECPFGVQQKGS